jgi:hypothetical protein
VRTNTRRAPRRSAPKRRKGAIAGGKAEQLGWPVERYDQRQLAIGIETELEHTSDPSIAREIAMDHLAEQVLEGKPQDYYTRLAKMEANPMSDEEWDALFERQQRDKAAFMREAAGRFGQSGTVIVRGADWALITLTRSTYPGVNYQVTRWDIEDGQVVPLGHVDVKGDLDAALQELWWFASKKDGVRFQDEMTAMTPNPITFPQARERLFAYLRSNGWSRSQPGLVENKHSTEQAANMTPDRRSRMMSEGHMRRNTAQTGKGTWAYTEEGRVFVPEKQFNKLPPGFHVVPLRGYAHTWAVMRDDDSCDGWILQEDLPGGGPGYDPNPRKTPSPSSGYAYKADESVHDRNFRQAPDDVWETVMITPERGLDWHHLGTRYIDNAKVNVWRVTEPMSGEKVYYAQTVALTGNARSIPTFRAGKSALERFGAEEYESLLEEQTKSGSSLKTAAKKLGAERGLLGPWTDDDVRLVRRGMMGNGMEPNPQTGNGEESIPPIDDLDENSDPQTEAAIKTHESRFGRIFALYNYPGEVVRISRRSSYRGSSGPMLYVQRVYQGNWVDFVKGTPSELMRESSRGWMGDGMEPNPYQSQARAMLINGEDPASVVRHLQANGMDEESALRAMEQAVSEIT